MHDHQHEFNQEPSKAVSIEAVPLGREGPASEGEGAEQEVAPHAPLLPEKDPPVLF